jgi:hypothetical protein
MHEAPWPPANRPSRVKSGIGEDRSSDDFFGKFIGGYSAQYQANDSAGIGRYRYQYETKLRHFSILDRSDDN